MTDIDAIPPYTDSELAERAALALRDGDTRDAATFKALTVNRIVIDTACETLRNAAQSLPPRAAAALVQLTDEMQAVKR